ncbi:MAG: long-chain fatty acid--CoA ligase [Actinomycetota bacterium]|nr:long-chain fatty acid--CoA ligase [Actinomycetota bacterium]
MATVETQAPRALQATTLCEAFQITASERPDQPAVRAPGDEGQLTFGELRARVERIARGLAGLGVGRGDTVGLMMLNRPEFHACDLGVLHAGGVPFSIYNTSAPEQISYLFGNAGNGVVITERMFLPAITAAGFDGHVVLIDGGADDGATSLEELEAGGDDAFDVEAAWRAVEPDDLLTLIYTSGTTGPPKGVQLTHRNLMAMMRGYRELVGGTPGGRIVSFLPSAHIADRWGSHYQSLCVEGFTVTSIVDPRAVVAALPEVRPTVWGAVPRVWEKLKAALEANGVTDPAALPEEARAAVRAKLGLDAVERSIVGAAPTPVEVLEFFDALGLRILEVWGMSETSAISTINPPDRPRFGTCGVALPGVELRIADDGEVLVRGDHIMVGYRNDEAKTRETFTDDGWLMTGDIGEVDADGYLRIVDRKKELIINAAGKNMSPANIEARLKAAHPLIGQACVIGDGRPYNVALIVLDPDVAGGADPSSFEGTIASAVEEANSHLSRVEQVKRYTVLDSEWMPGGDELTPTMKLKRKPIAEKYAAEIEALYA